VQLVSIETSRIICLTQMNRGPTGQPYLPDAASKLQQKYSFAKLPTITELTSGSFAFAIGKFRDVQINELQVYPDGVIVSTRADTEILEGFLSDLFSWAEREFGLTPIATAKPEKFIESAIVVKSETDLSRALSPSNDVAAIVNRAIQEKVTRAHYQIAGFTLDSDPAAFLGRRKPMRFGIERRLNVPFNENVFYSYAPLHTQHHLKVLSELEALPIAARHGN
jgi:hypothetical protein